MKTFTVDPRDGGFSGACNTCCCQSTSMRPGATDKFVINYAPWSVPLGGVGLIQGGTLISVEVDASACQSGSIDGIAPPAMTLSIADIISDGSAQVKPLTPVPTPVDANKTYRIVGNSGPSNGDVAITDNSAAPKFSYKPNLGFVGYDSFWIEATDAQGRKVVAQQIVRVGAPTGPAPILRFGIFIDQSKIKVNSRLHQIEFPVSMLPNARQCEVYKLTISQTARDCADAYVHPSCYEIHVDRC